jgi:hypothetical protein
MSNKYTFNALNNAKTIDQMREMDVGRMQIEEIVILPYLIITESLTAPILTYVLKKRQRDSTCGFVFEREMIVTNQNVDSIVENSRDVLRRIMMASTDNHSFCFKGLNVIGRKLFILFELNISYINVLSSSSSSSSPIIFVTISEILNDMCVGEYSVPQEVHSIFLENLEMCVLQNEHGGIYETPSVYYTHSPLSVIEHDALFCPLKHNIGDTMKVQCYENFGRTLEKARSSNVKSGIIRVCVFMGIHRVELAEMVVNESLFDDCDSVSVLSSQNISRHFIKKKGCAISLSYYEI